MTAPATFLLIRRGLRRLAILAGLPLWAGAQAQNPGSVSGTLREQGTGLPVPFVSILLLRVPDSTAYVTGAQTAVNGTFTLHHVAPGRYTLRATALGYQGVRRPVTLTAAQPALRLGTLPLLRTSTHLQGVRVEGQQATVVDNLDKKIINVAKDLTSVGGSAVNVLQNVPSVTVDPNGTVSLRGTSNVTIYIDGKLSSAGSMNTLAQIPASSIATVEVMTNPSARYDAAGSGGIINIVLKKEKKDGYHGQATGNLGTRGRYNVSLNLNRHRHKFNFFTQYDFRLEPNRAFFAIQNLTFVDSLRNQSSLTQTSWQRLASHSLRLGVDYMLSPEQALTLTVQPRFNHQPFTDQVKEGILSVVGLQPAQSSVIEARTVSRVRTRSADLALDYRRTWATHPGRELSASLFYSPLRTTDQATMRQNPEEPGPNHLLQDRHIARRFDQATAQLDYVRPLGAKGRLEAGLKSTLRRTDGENRLYRFGAYDSARSNGYLYREYIQAGYALYQRSGEKFSYHVGLRAEQSNTRGLLRNTQQHFNRNYLSLFPSVTLKQKLPAEQVVQLGYSRRINRPDIDLLLPFADIVNPRLYWIGNPRLRPELVQVLELGHQKSWGAATLTSTAFYRQTTDLITRAVRVLENTASSGPYTVTEGTRINIPRNTTYGLELALNQPLTNWWRLTANGSAFRRSISTIRNFDHTYRSFSYTSRLNMTVTPVKKLEVQLIGSYASRVVTAYGLGKANYFVDLALRQEVLKDRGSVTVRLSDVFNTLAYNLLAYGEGTESTWHIKRETRIGFVGFNYRFGTGQAQATRVRKQEQTTKGE